MTSILLVEDSKFLRLASERALIKAGYSVVSTDDGEHALRVAQERIPDLILLDMLLPKLGGSEVLRALKKDPATAQIPVVVLSSLPQKNEAKLKKDGAAAYFEKAKLHLDSSSQSLLDLVKAMLAT
ncbi:MAG TPA: response regulator [Candidatus Sulfotelmatobacter sp.]|nr:response regulator [Candidatus Sulfotelmatobacter sp.]